MLFAHIQKKLKNFTLDLHFSVKNEIIVLYGPSGSGKTTVLHCLAGLKQPDKGHIQLNNRTFYETGKKPTPVQKREIGYVFQDYALFPHMTVEKNILYGTKNRERVLQLVRTLGIDHLLKEYPGNISGGEKQRVALARAFAMEPKLLLLDEPFSSLDERVKDESHEELLRLQKERNLPVILVTHDEREAHKLANRMIYLNKGKQSGERE